MTAEWSPFPISSAQCGMQGKQLRAQPRAGELCREAVIKPRDASCRAQNLLSL